MIEYWVGYNDGRDEQAFRVIKAISIEDAAQRFADQEYLGGHEQPEYEVLVKLTNETFWEVTVETRVEFDVFIN